MDFLATQIVIEPKLISLLLIIDLFFWLNYILPLKILSILNLSAVNLKKGMGGVWFATHNITVAIAGLFNLYGKIFLPFYYSPQFYRG